MYLGWARGGTSGATAAGLAPVGPSFAMVLVLSAFYMRHGGLPWMLGAFYGIGAAVIAIVARGTEKLLQTTVGRDPLLWLVALVNAVVVGMASTDTLFRILGFFAEAAVVVFGSGLAVVPFLHGGVDREYGWPTERQFLDGVAVSMITPGPVVITVAFTGYLIAGPVGGLIAAIGMFLPTYLAVVAVAPWFHRVTGSRRLRALVDGVTAAATGAIAGAVVVLGRRALIDIPKWLIALAALLVLARVRRVPEPLVIVVAG